MEDEGGYNELSGVHRAIDLDGESIASIGITPGKLENRYTWEVAYWIGQPVFSRPQRYNNNDVN